MIIWTQFNQTYYLAEKLVIDGLGFIMLNGLEFETKEGLVVFFSISLNWSDPPEINEIGHFLFYKSDYQLIYRGF